MSSPLHLRSRFRSLLSRAKAKLKREANTLAYAHLPLKEKTIQLAQEQCLTHASEAFKVFGHTTLRGILSAAEVHEIAAGLATLGAGLENSETKITIAPVEKCNAIQKIIFNSELHEILTKIIPPFWHYGSDAFVGYPVFGKHRDTFLSPPFLKVFIPLVPCTFSVLPGSHCAGDYYASRAGKYVTAWDSGKTLSPPVSEVYFTDTERKVVADVAYLNTENLFTRIHLDPGDIFIFHQNQVHGLDADHDKNFFLSVTIVPSPAASHEYGLTRAQHVDRVIENIVATAACDFQLSAQRNLDPEENLFKGYKFNDEDLSVLVRNGGWHDCFGLRFIGGDRWIDAYNQLKHKGIQHIQDEL